MIKAVFRVALRALEGLIGSIIKILGRPHYTRFSRRAKGLQIPLRGLLKPGERLHVVFDSRGVKVYGEGEWKVRKHRYSKRRTSRKVHVGMCADSGQVVVCATTSNNVNDDIAMINMMQALEGTPIGDVLGDGVYEKIDCREAVHDRGGRQIIPPDKNAKLQQGKPLPALQERDRAIRGMQEGGYHRRSRLETLMFRYKTILGDRLTTRTEQTQSREVAIKLDVLNCMRELGRPKSYKVAI